MPTLESYQLYAVRYATHARRSSENFLGGDPHDTVMPLDFYVWVAKSPERCFVIDTGFGADEAARRERERLRCPTEGLQALDIDAAEIEDVILTHLHYDHAGCLDKFPKARFHLQDTEMAFATGRHMCHLPMDRAYSVEDAVAMVRHVYAGRVSFHEGVTELAPGLSVHHVGGHTMGLQVVRVHTDRGWVVVASDASHFYANMDEVRPFPIIYNLADMIDAYATVRRLADSADHVVPGHDPLVMARYPPPAAELEGIAVRLDVAPRTA